MKKYILPVMLAGLVLATSCNKTLETKSVNSADANITRSQAAGVEAMLNSAFNTLQGATYYGRDLIVVPELLSDNMRIVASNSNRFTNEANNVNGATIALWQNAYIVINKLNGVLKYADPATGFSDLRRKQIKGEAYFLRAMTYFDLVKVYSYNPRFVIAAQDRGGVPIVLNYVEDLTTDITYPSRATTAAVYTQIKADLTLALNLLDNTQGATHPNKAAAYGLLSRINLYLGEWQDCVDNSTKAINEGVGTFAEAATGAAATTAEKSAAYKAIWTTPSSKESLFELNYEATESLGSDALSSFYTKNTLGVPSTGGAGYGDAAPQANLVAAYEAGDVRKDLLFQIVKGSETILWNQKYPGLKAPQVDNIKLMRISEMYLNRAEANVQLGTATSLASALVDLNKIRARAGLAPAATATFANVFAERRVELAYEGQRYFDLLRTGSDINKSSNTLPASIVYSTTIPYSDFRLLARIPIGEVSVNPNLKQNFGY